MRFRKRLVRARAKGSPPIQFPSEAQTAPVGLSLIGDFLQLVGRAERIPEVFADREFDTDYGSFRMTLAVVGLILVGGTRLAHLRELAIDPVF